MTTTTANGSNNNQADDQPEPETKFVRLMNSSQKKLASMKFIDAKTLAENMIFPIFAALYEEMDTELDGVFDRLDNMEVDDDVVDALADSPQFIRDFSTYVLWVGNTFDTVLRLGGFIATNEKDKTQAVFTTKANDEVKKIYQEIAQTNEAIIGKIKSLEEKIAEYEADDSTEGEPVGDPDDLPAESQTDQMPDAGIDVQVDTDPNIKIPTSSPPPDSTEVKA